MRGTNVKCCKYSIAVHKTTTINMINQLDINLLVVLNTLLEEKHVSNTAFCLNLSQSKVSRSLQKLRTIFNDELLIRTITGYELTPKAQSLKGSLSHVLYNLDKLFQSDEFHPEQSNERIRFFCPASVANVIFPDVIAHISRTAPKMRIELDSNHPNHFDALLNGDIHFAISTHTPTSGEGEIHRLKLLDWQHCLLMRRDHPLASVNITEHNLANFPSGQIAMNGQPLLPLDTQIARLGSHQIQATPPFIQLSDFTSAAAIAEKTDIVFHVPKELAQRSSNKQQLTLKAVPDSLVYPNECIYLYWHKRYHNDAMCTWIRSLFKEWNSADNLVSPTHLVPVACA